MRWTGLQWMSKGAGVAAVVLLSGCASNPFGDGMPPDVDRTATPARAVAEPAELHGRAVMWGGSVVAVHNLMNNTEIAVLSYPLDDDGYPDTAKETSGRFILRYNGFLDPLNYQPGRLVTVLGEINGIRKGMVGEASYRYPIIDAEKVRLWKKPPGLTYPRFLFGIGTGVGF